jgi:hypothetical protein
MTDLDNAITSTLTRRAMASSPSAPPVTEIADRHRRQARRRSIRNGGLAACCLIAAGAGIGGYVVMDQSTSTTVALGTPTSIPADVPNAAVPGWDLTNTIERGDYFEFEFRSGNQRLQVSYYAGDLIKERLRTDEDGPNTAIELLPVRGTDGFVPHGFPQPDFKVRPGEVDDDLAAGMTRIDWKENGWTIEATGTGIATNDELIYLLSTLQAFDQ